MRTLTMTQTNLTGTYQTYDNVFARRQGMRDAAMLMMENLNTNGSTRNYLVKENDDMLGYGIYEMNNLNSAVWIVIAL